MSNQRFILFVMTMMMMMMVSNIYAELARDDDDDKAFLNNLQQKNSEGRNLCLQLIFSDETFIRIVR